MAEIALLDRITALSDDEAVGLLERFLKARPPSERAEVGGPELLVQCRAAGIEPGSHTSRGDVARVGLLVLTQDDQIATMFEQMLATDAPRTRSFIVTEIAVLALAVGVLQTSVSITRDEDGKWTLDLQKSAADAELIKKFLSTVSGWLGRGGPGSGS